MYSTFMFLDRFLLELSYTHTHTRVRLCAPPHMCAYTHARTHTHTHTHRSDKYSIVFFCKNATTINYYNKDTVIVEIA